MWIFLRHLEQSHLFIKNCLVIAPVNFPSLQYGKKELAPYKPIWDWIWESIPAMSKNPAHQLIHFKLIHKAYATTNMLHRMKRLSTPLCTLCNSNTVGTYMHMFFDCPIVSTFWDKVFLVVSELCDRFIPKHPNICLLNDDSDLNLNVYQRRILHAAPTATKKVIFFNLAWTHISGWQNVAYRI